MQQAFHVYVPYSVLSTLGSLVFAEFLLQTGQGYISLIPLFRADPCFRSGSMSYDDRQPLQNTPASARIIATANDRFGAVLSSLFSFWSARAAAIGSGGNAARRDAYSVILFNHGVLTAIEDDFTSPPDQLLDALLPYEADGGTNYTTAITHAQGVMETNWSTER